MTEAPFSLTRTEREVGALIYLDEVESTNVFARDADVAPYTLVLTDNQTKGRGRLDREWMTPRGNGLAVSFVIPSDDRVVSWYPLVAGWSLVEEVRSSGIARAEMKWPNDILLGDKKLAGILCEVLPENRVIVGLGINLAVSETEFFIPSATSLFGEGSIDWTVVDDILAGWVRRLTTWSMLPSERKKEFADRNIREVLATLGRDVLVEETTGRQWAGMAQGLDEAGHLLVLEKETGKLQTVASADITHLYQ